MAVNKKKPKVLSDHKKVGKRLIPPLMQLDRIVETSFRDDTLPDLIWMAAIFRQTSDKEAIDLITGFLKLAKESIADDRIPPLAFLSNFNSLTEAQKNMIRQAAGMAGILVPLQDMLLHQQLLLPEYPLFFIFDDKCSEIEAKEGIEEIKGDVDFLLDRYSHGAMKVQTTAVVSMLVTGKMVLSASIDIPEFDAVITAPDSERGWRAGSFVRSTLNAGKGFDSEMDRSSTWAQDFWRQVFSLEGCE